MVLKSKCQYFYIFVYNVFFLSQKPLPMYWMKSILFLYTWIQLTGFFQIIMKDFSQICTQVGLEKTFYQRSFWKWNMQKEAQMKNHDILYDIILLSFSCMYHYVRIKYCKIIIFGAVNFCANVIIRDLIFKRS